MLISRDLALMWGFCKQRGWSLVGAQLAWQYHSPQERYRPANRQSDIEFISDAVIRSPSIPANLALIAPLLLFRYCLHRFTTSLSLALSKKLEQSLSDVYVSHSSGHCFRGNGSWKIPNQLCPTSCLPQERYAARKREHCPLQLSRISYFLPCSLSLSLSI